MGKLLEAGRPSDEIGDVANHAYKSVPKAMKKEGPDGFVKYFDLIKRGWMDQSKKGKTA